jgi:hypothetical protein
MPAPRRLRHAGCDQRAATIGKGMDRMERISTIERAYQLARHGPCTSLTEIRKQLKRENLDAVDQHLSGRGLSRELIALCRARRNMLANAGEPSAVTRPDEAGGA